MAEAAADIPTPSPTPPLPKKSRAARRRELKEERILTSAVDEEDSVRDDLNRLAIDREPGQAAQLKNLKSAINARKIGLERAERVLEAEIVRGPAGGSPLLAVIFTLTVIWWIVYFVLINTDITTGFVGGLKNFTQVQPITRVAFWGLMIGFLLTTLPAMLGFSRVLGIQTFSLPMFGLWSILGAAGAFAWFATRTRDVAIDIAITPESFTTSPNAYIIPEVYDSNQEGRFTPDRIERFRTSSNPRVIPEIYDSNEEGRFIPDRPFLNN